MVFHDDQARISAIRREYPPGQRVRFLHFGGSDPSDLPAGTAGTVRLVDSVGTVHVDWDNGVRLGCVLLRRSGTTKRDRIAKI